MYINFLTEVKSAVPKFKGPEVEKALSIAPP